MFPYGAYRYPDHIWLEETFRLAKEKKGLGVGRFIHSNPNLFVVEQLLVEKN